ncbi:hypothetical protein [Chitinophaga qingshengii]|uniref:Uncharacterized protein n=1 Tax=Chitinophaga qingshengii TaxID=1569794 RepID=A0ABR7TT16_9BACT|nr:hypothetical protein [Chitinophaga qingshengii]MBC9932549.1 hypothetical protein [Chitinophaga qingshengii]
MTNKQKELLVFSEKIQQGAQKAVRKLVEARAASGKSLVIGDKNGNVKIVPAKELLSAMK